MVLLAWILSFELHAQTDFYNPPHFNLQPMKLKNSSGKFKETSYHLGVDYGTFIDVTRKSSLDEYLHSLWGYYDINIGEEILYFRLESGIITDWKFSGGAGFASLGVNYRIKKFDRHIIYLLFGIAGWYSGNWAGLLGIINPKYVFMLNDGFGLSLGVRYMPALTYDQHFLGFSAGVQFFY